MQSKLNKNHFIETTSPHRQGRFHIDKLVFHQFKQERNKKPLFMAFEYELCVPGTYAAQTKKMVYPGNDFFKTYDDCGFLEVTSSPATLKVASEAFKSFFKANEELMNYNKGMSNVGRAFHINIDLAYFEGDEKKIANLFKFVNNDIPHTSFKKFFGRDKKYWTISKADTPVGVLSHNYIHDVNGNRKEITSYEGLYKYYFNKGHSLAYRGNRLEFREPCAPYTVEEALQRLQFSHAMVLYCTKHEEVSWNGFIKYVMNSKRKLLYPELQALIMKS